MKGIVIVGAGQAGSTLAETLRAKGYEGPVTMIGAEAFPPYERPPLSKAYLLGDYLRERLYLRQPSVYAEKDITLRLGSPVTKIDPDAKTVALGDETIEYDQVALVTGGIPNTLPAAIGGDLDKVFTVRTLGDIERLQPHFNFGARVLVVGGGYIGLEAAAVASKLGLKVTLVEMADRILGRVASVETADAIRAVHKAHGVDIREGTGLETLIGENGVVTSARLADGSELSVDFVIVGTGIRPETALAEAAGVHCENGIVVDEFGRTSVEGIWAAGDCAVFDFKGAPIRLESVQNAIDQSTAVAENMLGANEPYQPVPWFWSDQFNMKLQIAGINRGYDQIIVRQTAAGLSHWYFQNGTFLAVDAINAPRDYMVGLRILQMGKSLDADTAADPEADLKAILKA